MTALPARGTFVPGSRANSAAGAALEELLAYHREDLGGGFQDTTIVDGAITALSSKIWADTQAGAAIDDLDRINVGSRPPGSLLMLHSRDAGRDVRVRGAQGGSGQIFLHNPPNQGSTLVLSDPSMCLILQRDTGLGWTEVGRLFGAHNGAMRDYLGLQMGSVTPIASPAEMQEGTTDARIVTPLKLNDFMGIYDRVMRPRAVTTAFDPDAEVVIGKGEATSRGNMWRIPLRNLFGGSFVKYFESGEVSSDGGTSGSLPHGLGGMPKLMKQVLRCKVAAAGFSVGDEVDFHSSSGGGQSHIVQAAATGVDMFWRIRNRPAVLNASFVDVDIDPAQWRLVLRAWR